MSPVERALIAQSLERFIVEELLEDEQRDGRDPLATEAIDSLGIEQLVEYIDEEFGVKLGDAEVLDEHFESIPALAALVAEKCLDT